VLTWGRPHRPVGRRGSGHGDRLVFVNAVCRRAAAASRWRSAMISRATAAWSWFVIKHSPPTAVQLIDLDPTRRYDLTSLVDGLAEPPGMSSRDPAERSRSGRTDVDRALLAIPATTYALELTGRVPDRAGKIPCPFHEDRTPSLQLYDDGTWFCYGKCQAGGSIYDFASRRCGLGTKGASFLALRDRLAQELSLPR